MSTLRRFRSETVEVELENGRVLRLPVRWTSLGDAVGKEASARLSLEGAVELSRFVSDRVEAQKSKKFGSFNKNARRMGKDGSQATRQDDSLPEKSRQGGVVAVSEGGRGAGALVVEM